MNKKTKKKIVKKANTISSEMSNAWAKSLQAIYKDWVYPSICNIKPPTKAQLARWERERMAKEKKEAKRRAKKITMTIGELEDKIQEAESRYEDDY